MTYFRTALMLLLFAGFAGAQAQPLVKINAATNECDVTANPNEPIFQFDSSGNVLINGTLSGAGCGGVQGTQNATFTPFNPAPAPLAVSGNIVAGSGTANASYTAVYASGGCSLSKSAGVVAGSGTCPALTVSGGSCTGSGAVNTCVGSATISEPTALAGTVTSCTYNLTATCNPGTVTSTASIIVTPSGGGGDTGLPAACQNLASIGTGSGGFWSKVNTSSVKYGDGTTQQSVDITNYVKVWNYTGDTNPWPGNNITTRVSTPSKQYMAQKFTVPTDGSVTGHPKWAWTGSGDGFSETVSICPGDFGQTGTQITSFCSADQSASGSGISVAISSTTVPGYCTVHPGTTYYLNILPKAPLPTGDVSVQQNCTTNCLPYAARY